jgi:hypothetical protein
MAEKRGREITGEELEKFIAGLHVNRPKKYRDDMRIKQSSAPYGSRDYVRFKKSADYVDDLNEKEAAAEVGLKFQQQVQAWAAKLPYEMDLAPVLEILRDTERTINEKFSIMSDVRKIIDRDLAEAGLPLTEDRYWGEEDG